jgi:hypothetical protein
VKGELTRLEVQSKEICEEYLFVGKALEKPLLEYDAQVIEAVRLYCVRHKRYKDPAIYTHFFASPLDARFNRTWGTLVFGMSQTEADHYKTPIFFTVSSKTKAAAVPVLAAKLSTIKPNFHINLGDLVESLVSTNIPQWIENIDAFRKSFMSLDLSTPLVRVQC